MGVVYKSRGISSTIAKYTLVKHELDMTIEHGKRWVALNNVQNIELEIDSAPYTPLKIKWLQYSVGVLKLPFRSQ